MAENRNRANEGETGIRKHPRIRLKPLSNVYIKLTSPVADLTLANISLGGVGILLSSIKAYPVKTVLSGDLMINDSVYKIALEVMHLQPDYMGCRFEAPSDQLQKAIGDYFINELDALKMNCVEKNISTHNGENVLFFHGKNNCQILVKKINDVVTSFSISFFGNYFEGESGNIMLMAEKVPLEGQGPPRKFSIFKKIKNVDQGTLIGVITLVENVPNLTQLQKESIISGFKRVL